jgi:hypothetical protein
VVGDTETLPRGGGDGIDGIEPMGERHEAAAESAPREIAVLCVCRVPCAVVGGYGTARARRGGGLIVNLGAVRASGPGLLRRRGWYMAGTAHH